MFKKRLQLLEKTTALFLVFLIPSQLAIHFWPPFSFVFGIRVDYLSPAIYLTDILIFLLVLSWFINDRKSFPGLIKKRLWTIALLLVFALINTFFSTSGVISVFKWVKIMEIALFTIYIHARKTFVGVRVLIKTLFYSALFFSVVGVVQFLLGRTTGLFWILGERTFKLMTPGIALVQILGRDYLRAYSTFPHPNALAGYLGAVLLLVTGTGHLKEDKRKMFGVLLIALGMLLTFSFTGILGLIFSLCLYVFRKKGILITMTVKIFVWASVILSLFLPILSAQSFLRNSLSKNLAERLDLAFLSGKMISGRFLLGEGLNTFIANIPAANKGLVSPWLLQPVHNIYLLVLAETGITGLLVFLWAVFALIERLIREKKFKYLVVFVFIIFTGIGDHYWLTLQQNLLFLSLLLGFV